jgi:hypothetical protein
MSSEVHSGGAPIIASFTTTDSGTPIDNTVTTIIREELASLLMSDAKTIERDQAFVAYCVRLNFLTNDVTPLVANSPDEPVYFTGMNNCNASFDVNVSAETDDT